MRRKSGQQSLAAHIQAHAVDSGHPSVARISPGTVTKLLTAQDLHPHRVPYYCERRGPAFEEKMVQVLHVYQQVEREFAHPVRPRLSGPLDYDEKPGNSRSRTNSGRAAAGPRSTRYVATGL